MRKKKCYLQLGLSLHTKLMELYCCDIGSYLEVIIITIGLFFFFFSLPGVAQWI